MVTFPKLYSKNSDGSINEWQITVDDNRITKRYGKLFGALMEETEVVLAGKNGGKKNETSIQEQALKQAESKWTKKKKSGYVTSVEDAKGGIVDSEVILGGVEPMLAQKFRDHSHKVVFPAFVQPKLDGIRCVAMFQSGKCSLWTRTRKRITSVPHIEREIERQLAGRPDCTLDGELYNHELKSDFEKIVSLVRSQDPCQDSHLVQYHVYDTVSGLNFNERTSLLSGLLRGNKIIYLVDTKRAMTPDDINSYFDECRKLGYEGCMVRNTVGPYEMKRSYNLQKVKEFDDKEFEIVDVFSGKGSMDGKAIFTCKLPNGRTVDVKLMGSLDRLERIFNRKSEVIGKLLTVRYQGETKDGSLRFPVGISIRDYE